jgi:hypothetical protein
MGKEREGRVDISFAHGERHFLFEKEPENIG